MYYVVFVDNVQAQIGVVGDVFAKQHYCEAAGQDVEYGCDGSCHGSNTYHVIICFVSQACIQRERAIGKVKSKYDQIDGTHVNQEAAVLQGEDYVGEIHVLP